MPKMSLYHTNLKPTQDDTILLGIDTADKTMSKEGTTKLFRAKDLPLSDAQIEAFEGGYYTRQDLDSIFELTSLNLVSDPTFVKQYRWGESVDADVQPERFWDVSDEDKVVFGAATGEAETPAATLFSDGGAGHFVRSPKLIPAGPGCSLLVKLRYFLSSNYNGTELISRLSFYDELKDKIEGLDLEVAVPVEPLDEWLSLKYLHVVPDDPAIAFVEITPIQMPADATVGGAILDSVFLTCLESAVPLAVPDATSGLMTGADKAKIDTVEHNANAYVHPDGHDASEIVSGTLDLARVPQGALDRLFIVADAAERFALTSADVQTGDTVKQDDINVMFRVVDDTKLDQAAGYVEYSAARAAAVAWSGVEDKPDTYPPAAHGHDAATTEVAGFLSAADKAKLDGVADNANAYVHPANHDDWYYTKPQIDQAFIDYDPETGGPHAASHVTGGIDVIANAVAGGNSGLMSGADKTKVDSLDLYAGLGANLISDPTFIKQAAGGNYWQPLQGSGLAWGPSSTVVFDAAYGENGTSGVRVNPVAEAEWVWLASRLIPAKKGDIISVSVRVFVSADYDGADATMQIRCFDADHQDLPWPSVQNKPILLTHRDQWRTYEHSLEVLNDAAAFVWIAPVVVAGDATAGYVAISQVGVTRLDGGFAGLLPNGRVARYDGDLNDIAANSLYNINSTISTNGPPTILGTKWGFVWTQVHVNDPAYRVQICWTMNTGAANNCIAMRQRDNTGWLADWQEVALKDVIAAIAKLKTIDTYCHANGANMVFDPTFIKQVNGGDFWIAKQGAGVPSAAVVFNAAYGENDTSGVRLNAVPETEWVWLESRAFPAKMGDRFLLKSRVFISSDYNGTQAFQQLRMMIADGVTMTPSPPASSINKDIPLGVKGSWINVEGTYEVSNPATEFTGFSAAIVDGAATAGYIAISSVSMTKVVSGTTHFSTAEPAAGDGADGDIWFQYEA